MSKGAGGMEDRRVEINPGRQLYRRPDGRVVEGSAGAPEAERYMAKGFVSVTEEAPEEAVSASVKGGKSAKNKR